MKTKSLWGAPPSRFYAFLKRIESHVNTRPIKICILGCADGKFVLPCARRGYEVLALDIDSKAIFGGTKLDKQGEVVMPGLIKRLEVEGLSRSVDVHCKDFVEYMPETKYHAAFTSGAINYSYNTKHDLNCIINSITNYVMVNGLVYFDYMLPMDDGNIKPRYYLKKGQLKEYIKPPQWNILFDRVLPPQMEKAHVDMPVDHYHHWGHLCAIKES